MLESKILCTITTRCSNNLCTGIFIVACKPVVHLRGGGWGLFFIISLILQQDICNISFSSNLTISLFLSLDHQWNCIWLPCIHWCCSIFMVWFCIQLDLTFSKSGSNLIPTCQSLIDIDKYDVLQLTCTIKANVVLWHCIIGRQNNLKSKISQNWTEHIWCPLVKSKSDLKVFFFCYWLK